MIKVSNADGAGAIRYEQLTADQYAAAIQAATTAALAVDYADRTGQRRNPWGRYVMLYPENRTPAKVTAFEAAIGWSEP